MKETPWWKRAVIYQVYPRSFADSNGDGIGDIPGILAHLDYLETLGIDAIWLSPVYCSPQYDNGYDISDYRGIDPLFGTMEDMECLIAEAGARGIRIVMDLVLNHSSDEHPWFLSAKSDRESPYHDYYIWRGPEAFRAEDGPDSFGQASWKWVPEIGQVYYYQFSEKQPDLNWANPALRRELYDMIRWWADKGLGGFRLDVVDHLGKDPELGVKVKGPRLHDFLREMRREAFVRPDLMTVGEAWSATPEEAKRYSDPAGSELSMVFGFEHIKLDQRADGDKWDLAPLPFLRFKRVMETWQTELHGCGWNSLFWENHDLPRIVSRWGDDGAQREACAKMLAVLLLGMEGTPFLYQGQELGMTNIALREEQYNDVETLNMIRDRRKRGVDEATILRAAAAKSRDNARTPMQWDAGENAGFTSGTPWLPVNPNYREINAAEQLGRPDSVFSCYRELIRLRHTLPVLSEGAFRLLLPEHEAVFAYERENAEARLLVECNFYGDTIPDPLDGEERGELLLSNLTGALPGTLRPYEARIYLKNTKGEH